MAIIPGPSVLPQYQGGNMGEALANAFMTKYQLDRQKALDAIQYGIGLQWPGSQTSSAPQSSDAPVGFGDKLRAALSHVGIGSNPVPAKQAEWKLAQGGPSVSVTPNAAQGGLVAGGMEGSRGWDESPDGATLGGLPDYMTLPNGQRMPTIMTPFGSRIMQVLAMRAEIGQRSAEAEKAAADAALSRHRNLSPVFGEDGYNAAKAGEAGAVANAQLPVELQKIGAENAGRLGAARISAGATLGAANIGANSRREVANIEQGGANTRQANQQQFQLRSLIPAQTTANIGAHQQNQIFSTSQSVLGRLGQKAGLLPTQPTTPLPGSTTSAPAAPNAKADRWEQYRQQGLSADEATRRVQQDFPDTGTP